MSAPHDPPATNVLPFPAQVMEAARMARPEADAYGFAEHAATQAATMAHAQSKFMLWTLEMAALYVEGIASQVAFAPPEALTRDNLLVMLRRTTAEIRALKAPPQPPPSPAPTTEGAA